MTDSSPPNRKVIISGAIPAGIEHHGSVPASIIVESTPSGGKTFLYAVNGVELGREAFIAALKLSSVVIKGAGE